MANVYRADHVGRLVKPQALVTAHEEFEAGKADAAARRAAEDAAIAEALELQKSVVMTVVTDGEFRRISPDEALFEAVEGLQRAAGPARNGLLQSAYVVSGKLQPKSRLLEREAAFLKARVQSHFKISLASPSALALRLYKPGVTEGAYRTVADLAAALGQILRSEVTALFQEGVQYVQLNTPAYHALFEGAGARLPGLPTQDAAALFEELAAIDAAAFKGIAKPASSTLAIRFGRVPELDDASDRYERMVARLLELLPVDRVLLEYGEPGEHDFESLKALPAGKMAVLGLVRVDGAPDEIGTVLDRIERAASNTAEEQLALSPRRGFPNRPGQPLADQLKAQRQTLVRTSEAVQQFWGLEL